MIVVGDDLGAVSKVFCVPEEQGNYRRPEAK